MVDELELPPPRHERSDVSPRLLWMGIPALILGVVTLALLVLWLFPGRTIDRTLHLPLPRYPAPALQVNPRADLAKFRAAKLQWLNSSGWIDHSRGITHIPIEVAMRKVAAEGIPDWPARPLAYTQKMGNVLPQQAPLRDEHGATVSLSGIAHGKPLVLILGYFHCPNLCGVVRADLFHALERTDLVGGRDYQLATLSIDPTETFKDAATAKAEDIARFPAAGAATGWHFLTGRAEVVQAVAQAVGFGNRPDPKRNQFQHPTGVVFVAPSGVISSYLLGVGYSPADVRLAITRATRGTIEAAVLPVLLLCYDYDESTGHYSLGIMKLLRLAGVLTVLTLGITLFLAFRRGRGAA